MRYGDGFRVWGACRLTIQKVVVKSMTIHVLGFRFTCDNRVPCLRMQTFRTPTLREASECAENGGWIQREGLWLCGGGCEQEHAGLQCDHRWPSRGPKAYVCVKCGCRRGEREGVGHE